MGIPVNSLTRTQRAYVAAAAARKRELQARAPGAPIEPAAPADGPTLGQIMDRKARGSLARENGEKFEADCLISARAAGINLWKIPSGAKWIGPGRIRPEKTPFDFCGAIPILGGRGMCFDAKSVMADATAQSLLINDEHGVKPHQTDAIREQGAGKWIAGILLQCGPRGDVRWLDWRFLKSGPAYRVKFDAPEWFSISPISRPIDFGRIVREYGGGHVP